MCSLDEDDEEDLSIESLKLIDATSEEREKIVRKLNTCVVSCVDVGSV